MQREIEEKEKNMNCELFDGIEGEELEKMLKCLSARRVKIERGQTLFAEGEAAGQVGVVPLRRGADPPSTESCPRNQGTILARLTEGGIFGVGVCLRGRGALSGRPRGARAPGKRCCSSACRRPVRSPVLHTAVSSAT